jgi:hypothetical protein
MYRVPLTPHEHMDMDALCIDIARLFGKSADDLNAPHSTYTTVYFELQGVIRGVLDHARQQSE